MNATLLAVGLLLTALPAYAGNSLTNPKHLVPPITLTRADYYFDGGSLGGTLCDSRGQHLDFFFDRSDGSTNGNLYIGFVSGHTKDSMKAHFNGWQADDLYAVIEQTIRQQFVWDATKKKLRPKEPALHPFTVFGTTAVTSILRYVERKLHPERTSMK